jgi:acyl-CoA synthetase (NDP forming)
VITSGLGTAERADLLAICRTHGMRLVGPNCLGVSVPSIGLNATFAARPPAPGTAGVVVQSGGLGVALFEHLSRLGIGVSSFASVGDKYDVSSNDLLTWWVQDGETRLAVLYVESFGSPRKFAHTARRVSARMPVLTVVGGRSAAGQRAAASHTAAAATPLVTQEALFAQAGVIVTHSLGELVEAAALLACQPLPAGNRVAIVSNAGGVGVLAADACGDNGLLVAGASDAVQRRLRELLPAGAAVSGPVDTTAAITDETFRACLEAVARDDQADAVIAVTVPTAISDLRAAVTTAAVGKPMAVVLVDQAESVRLLATAGGGSPDDHRADAGPEPGQAAGPAVAIPGLPAYAYPEDAARALGHAARYRAWRDRKTGKVPQLPGVRTADARKLVAGFLASRPAVGWLPPALVAELLACYEIPLSPAPPADGEQAAAGASPLSPAPPADGEQAAARAIPLSPALPADGEQAVAVASPAAPGGVEVQVRVRQEPVFGPVVVFGLGGTASGVLGDQAARLTPLTDTDADELIRLSQAAPLLVGRDGTPAADTGALASMLLRVSRLADDLPEVAELDLNPVITSPDGARVAAARARISPAQARDPFLRRLR